MPGKITLKYKKAYYQLLKKENLEKIKKILKKRKYLDRHIVDKITLEEKEGLPYLYLQVDSYEHLKETGFAMIDARFIDISSIVPGWPDIFYLPILITRETKNDRLKQFLNTEIDGKLKNES